MSRNGKVIVAMSGGVDSSVAACLLREQGYERVGVFMRVGVGGEATERTGINGSREEGSRDQGIEGSRDQRRNPAGQAGVAAPLPPHHVATLSPDTASPRRLKHGCCSVADALDARAVAARLGIPFYVLNFQADFERIIDYFVDEYARARTPNPCVLCNIQLKFGKLLRYADLLDAEFVATGHYARIVRATSPERERGVERTPRVDEPSEASPVACAPGSYAGHGRAPARAATPVARAPGSCAGYARAEARAAIPVAGAPGSYLARSLNRTKDQSYVLFGIRREDLPRCLFPVGEIADKAEVRRIAATLGLRVHDKPDSQEICFVPGGDYKELVRSRRPETQRPGEVRDAAGHVLGTHGGIAGYTVGQRRGLGIAAGRPIYVTRLDVLNNTVTVGPREDLLSTGLIAEGVNWLVDPPRACGQATPEEPRPAEPWRHASIKIRHMHSAAMGAIRVVGGPGPGTPFPSREGSGEGATVEARFDDPQSAVTPGQAAVFYDGEIVLGGGWIVRAIAAGP
jgi:tRNA-specific 2-thiouridylase